MSKDTDIPRITVEPTNGDDKPAETRPPADPAGRTERTVRMEPEADELTAPGAGPGVPVTSKYLILERIGDGGMGVVYLAQDRRLGRYVAIKRLNSSSNSRASLHQRFFQEAKAIAALHHIHIVQVYELGEDRDGPYIVMEYVPGPQEFSPNKTPPSPFALDDRVHREGPLTSGEALQLIIKVCRAVEYAHSSSIIHRDLKPSNILLDESGEPKIVDFGLARIMNKESVDQLTVPGEKMLSLGYGAPEQERDASQTDQRADVYGLGGLLYFSLTGQNPRYFRPDDMPEAIRMPIVKALEPDRSKRWQSVREFLDALLSIDSPSTIELPTIKRTWRCKWCDTVNPVTIRYCGKCGWDGGESCGECGSEIRTGIPFCGHCGAATRDYEMATRLHREIKKHYEDKEFRFIVEKADGISGFTPGGPNGRALVDDVYRLQDEARKAIRRRDKLRQSIPLDISAGDFERARRRIDEYNALASDNAFTEELVRLPALIRQRQIEQAERDIRNRNWPRAAQTCEVLRRDGAAASADVGRLTRQITYHRWRHRLRNTALIAIACFFLYVFSAAPVYRGLGKPESGLYHRIYGLVSLLHDFTVLQTPLDRYAELWRAGDPHTRHNQPPSWNRPVSPPTPPVNELAPLRAAYEKSITGIKTDYNQKVDAWPAAYLKALSDLQLQMQRAGDYEGWEAVQFEIDRFDEVMGITETDLTVEPIPLHDMQIKFSRMLTGYSDSRKERLKAETDKYLGKLKQIRSQYTRQNNMEKARSVSVEIERIQEMLPRPPAEPATPGPSDTPVP